MEVGDVLYVMSDDNEVMLSPVVEVRVEIKSGFYAPLTTDGKTNAN